MSFFDGYDIAVSGMSAQRTRVNVTSANIANAKTTHTEDGGPYKRQSVAFHEVLLQQNSKTNNNNLRAPLAENENDKNQLALRGVGVKSIIEDDSAPVMRYEPSHPDANDEGYVAYPNINPVIEMRAFKVEAKMVKFNPCDSIFLNRRISERPKWDALS